jgi:hypothetical protein
MPLCAEPNAAIKRANMANMPICAELNGAIKQINMTRKSINSVLQPRTVRTTVTAGTASQPLGPCLKQNLTNDTLDSLMKEFKDVFEADTITPLTGDPMQIHLKRDDPSYRPIRDVVRNIKTDSKWFCKLDAFQGYYQIPLDEKSSYLTSFVLPSGRYRFLRAPMGMKNSSDVFCHRTDNIFAAVPDLL